MGNVNKKDDEDSGMKRAAEFSDALREVPGYGDDSLFFIVRYITSLKVSKPPKHMTHSNIHQIVNRRNFETVNSWSSWAISAS